MNKFSTSLDFKHKIVRAVANGLIMKSDIEHMITAARKAAGEHGFNVLYDLRNATTKVPFAEWYYIPRNLPVFKEPDAKSVKGAMLISPEDKSIKDYQFYETVADNLGFQIRTFFDETEAINWLNENDLPQQ